MSGIAIGEYITVRNINLFIGGAKTAEGKCWLREAISNRIEIAGFIMLTVVRVSPRKYKIDEIMTETDSVVLDDGELTLTADWYDIKRFSAAVKTTYYNDLFGEQEEFRMQGDYEGLSA